MERKTMRHFLVGALILLPVVFGQNAPTIVPPIDKQPNVLLFILDDAAPVLSSYGGPAQTPNMDALAYSGVMYTQAVANSTGCNPSRVSFATGLLPSENCIHTMSQRDWRTVMAECRPGVEVKTFYQTFREAGYYTLAVGKVMHARFQQSPEFEVSSFYYPGDLREQLANIPLHGLSDYDALSSELKDWGPVEDLRGPNGETFTDEDLTDWRIIDESLRLLSEAPEDRPFFAAIGLVSPHVPRYVPSRLLNKYMDAPLPDVLLNDADDMPHAGRRLSIQNSQNRMVVNSILSDYTQWRLFNAAYYASIEFADEQIRRVLDAVQEAGKLENTIVVIWSDHGYHLGEKLKIEKGALWRESYHIPMIVSAPGIEAKAVTEVTNSTAMYETLLGLAGLTATDGINRSTDGPGLIFYDGHAALDDGERAYILYNAMNDQRKQQEFYDLLEDPKQWHNVASRPETTMYRQQLNQYLEDWR